MPDAPYRRSAPKIGRNDTCICGSGRKFKYCHGGPKYALPNLIASEKVHRRIVEEGKRQLEIHKVKELQRQKQQGLGKPIISIDHQGYRFVAVGTQLHYGRWKTFTDFLADYIKRTLDPAWGTAEIAKPWGERHPILQWYHKICFLQEQYKNSAGEVFSSPLTGAVSAYYRLSYNLYLIMHNGKDIQTRLIARLKNKGNFQGAFFETQVAAWLIKAGFELEFEDETDRASKHCEFTATHSPTGDKYSVEAKSRELEVGRSSRPKIGRKLYEALEKKADHRRLIFLNLNKPFHTAEEGDVAFDRAEWIIKRSESIEINGQPAPRAYVCITNMNDQYALDTSTIAMGVLFMGFKIPDFMGNQFPSIREAIRARERHLPMFQLFKSIEEHRHIPATFGGELPSDVFSDKPPQRMRIGEFYVVPGPDGTEVKAKVTHAIVFNKQAVYTLHDPVRDKAWLARSDLTPDELDDYEKYPDTFFGAYEKQNRRADTAVEMFDFFFETYRHTSREKLLELMAGHTDQEQLAMLSQNELAEIFCERSVNSMVASGSFAPRRKRWRAGDSEQMPKAATSPPPGSTDQ